jgi:hypothetical protein
MRFKKQPRKIILKNERNKYKYALLFALQKIKKRGQKTKPKDRVKKVK